MARAFNVESERSSLSLQPITRQRIVDLARHFDEASASAVVDMAIAQLWQREMGAPERDLAAEVDDLRQRIAALEQIAADGKARRVTKRRLVKGY